MTPKELFNARNRRAGAFLVDLFPKQRAFFDDPAKVKAAVCGRRAGKTWACAAGLYDSARKFPRSLNPYICLSAVAARRIMWPVLKDFNERYKLGMKLHDHELIAELPENGSSIFCVGGDDTRKVEALRGGKYGRAIIDEAGSFPRILLRYLCDDVLDASLMDYDGDMWLVGTPNAACVGHFHDVTTGKDPNVAKVSTHHWTVLDNVHIPHASEWLKRKQESKRWSDDNPVLLREYFGQWIRDTSSLVFRFDRARHMINAKALPSELVGVVGVDLGASENTPSTAFVTNGWAKFSKVVHTLRATKHADMNPGDGAEHLTALLKDFPGVHHAVVDAGGLGKGYVSEWRRRWGLPVQDAEKKNKMAYVALLNGELDAGKVKLVEGPQTLPLVEELELLQWNEDRDGYDDRFADHCADAWLYGWRECYAWGEKDPPNAGPPVGSRAYIEIMAAKAKEQAVRDAAAKAARDWRSRVR